MANGTRLACHAGHEKGSALNARKDIRIFGGLGYGIEVKMPFPRFTKYANLFLEHATAYVLFVQQDMFRMC